MDKTLLRSTETSVPRRNVDNIASPPKASQKADQQSLVPNPVRVRTKTKLKNDTKQNDGVDVQAIIKPVRKVGRPSGYPQDAFLPTVYQLARHGATYPEIAEAFRVSQATVQNWRQHDTEFLAAFKKGKDEHDSGKVESALLRRALGYPYTETSTKSVRIKQKGKNGKEQVLPALEVTVVEKNMAPDIGAAIFWLTNRQRERWQNTRYVQHAGKVEGAPAQVVNNYDFKDIDKAELETLRNALSRAIVQKDAELKKGNGNGNGKSDEQPTVAREGNA